MNCVRRTYVLLLVVLAIIGVQQVPAAAHPRLVNLSDSGSIHTYDRRSPIAALDISMFGGSTSSVVARAANDIGTEPEGMLTSPHSHGVAAESAVDR
jgi:hypothetical protein